MKKLGAFEAYEEIEIGVTNPGEVVRITGSPEAMERVLAFYLQSGEEVHGLSDEERERFLKMDIDT